MLDFGIAHAVGAERMTREKSLIGTIEYMSPERIQSLPVDGRSDLYAVGIVFFEALTGRLPSNTATEYDLLRWHVETVASPVTDFVDVPPALSEIVARAIAKKPEDRFRDCAEMAAALRDLARDLRVTLPSMMTLVPREQAARVMAPEKLRECFVETRRMIDHNDLAAAQRYLADTIRDNPGNPTLESLQGIIRAARLPSTRLNGTLPEDTDHLSLDLLRFIAAERSGDEAGADATLRESLLADTQSPILRILAAGRSSSAVNSSVLMQGDRYD